MNAPAWKAGAAAIAITPREPMWLAGWAARDKPAERTAEELFAKALALEDARGERLVIVTADLIAIPRALTLAVATRVHECWGLPRERLLFNASHTHTGPEVRPDKVPFFQIPEKFATRIGPYVAQLEEKLAGVISASLEKLEPARLSVGQARATFAHNRRAVDGPVDHEVPVLMIRGADDAPRAIVFGYACHPLTLPPSFCEFHGDYAGVAQRMIEEGFPGAIALFVSGAGADQDPAPRGTISEAEAHGRALAEAVADVANLTEMRGPLRVAFEEVELALQPLPANDSLEADARSDDAPRRRKAEFLLAAHREGRALPIRQACPIQVVRLGDELLVIALGGEPVVDFALQFKREFAGPVVWVAGYSNDMFGYLPTQRIQREGGYEAGRAALWSAVPMPLAELAEIQVIETVRRLAQTTV